MQAHITREARETVGRDTNPTRYGPIQPLANAGGDHFVRFGTPLRGSEQVISRFCMKARQDFAAMKCNRELIT
jgi:hypothetical protein